MATDAELQQPNQSKFMSRPNNPYFKLAQLHMEDERASNIFGIIAHSTGHPLVIKALEDEDYWRSLDETSGKRWHIYAAKISKGSYQPMEFRPGSYAYLSRVWLEPEENKAFLDEFHLPSTERLPLLLIFTEVNSKLEQIIISIEGDTIEGVYNSLRGAILQVTEALDKISTDNIKNTEAVLNAIQMNVEGYKARKAIASTINVGLWIKRLIG